jgi:hypothetical protein
MLQQSKPSVAQVYPQGESKHVKMEKRKEEEKTSIKKKTDTKGLLSLRGKSRRRGICSNNNERRANHQ